jgi:hypothetical protein
MRKRGYKPTPKQQTAQQTNFTIGQLVALQFNLRKLGYYEFEQRVRELEEQFRAHTGRAEKK